jgi:hypothetical protein
VSPGLIALCHVSYQGNNIQREEKHMKKCDIDSQHIRGAGMGPLIDGISISPAY